MKSKQQGSAHVLVTIILVVIILGLLGFVFWQNFIKAKPTTATTQTTTQTSTTTKTDTTTATPQTGFAVSQWGVTIPVAGTGYEIDKNNTDNTADLYGITTQAIVNEAAKISGCTDVDLGTIQRVASYDASDPTPHSAKIGNYYYGYYPRSQAACTDENGNPPQTLNGLMDDALNDLKAAIIHTAAS